MYQVMVVIIDGWSFHFAPTWSKWGISICWLEAYGCIERIFKSEKNRNFTSSYVRTCSELPSYISTMYTDKTFIRKPDSIHSGPCLQNRYLLNFVCKAFNVDLDPILVVEFLLIYVLSLHILVLLSIIKIYLLLQMEFLLRFRHYKIQFLASDIKIL